MSNERMDSPARVWRDVTLTQLNVEQSTLARRRRGWLTGVFSRAVREERERLLAIIRDRVKVLEGELREARALRRLGANSKAVEIISLRLSEARWIAKALRFAATR